MPFEEPHAAPGKPPAEALRPAPLPPGGNPYHEDPYHPDPYGKLR